MGEEYEFGKVLVYVSLALAGLSYIISVLTKRQLFRLIPCCDMEEYAVIKYASVLFTKLTKYALLGAITCFMINFYYR